MQTFHQNIILRGHFMGFYYKLASGKHFETKGICNIHNCKSDNDILYISHDNDILYISHDNHISLVISHYDQSTFRRD